jgi:hypothetical protein
MLSSLYVSNVMIKSRYYTITSSAAEPHHFDAAQGPGKIIDAAPASTLLYCTESQFLENKAKVDLRNTLNICMIEMITYFNGKSKKLLPVKLVTF